MRVIRIRLDTGEEREVNYYSEEDMYTDTEEKGEKVAGYWTCSPTILLH